LEKCGEDYVEDSDKEEKEKFKTNGDTNSVNIIKKEKISIIDFHFET
jgi:hypothetical protein